MCLPNDYCNLKKGALFLVLGRGPITLGACPSVFGLWHQDALECWCRSHFRCTCSEARKMSPLLLLSVGVHCHSFVGCLCVTVALLFISFAVSIAILVLFTVPEPNYSSYIQNESQKPRSNTYIHFFSGKQKTQKNIVRTEATITIRHFSESDCFTAGHYTVSSLRTWQCFSSSR